MFSNTALSMSKLPQLRLGLCILVRCIKTKQVKGVQDLVNHDKAMGPASKVHLVKKSAMQNNPGKAERHDLCLVFRHAVLRDFRVSC